ncbi:DUF3160 domain-containing protein [Candidatus Parcubacteria bacterium]|nr:DUF3160 domain-containing protein [Candidatus Parcubacteria bacterium]
MFIDKNKQNQIKADSAPPSSVRYEKLSNGASQGKTAPGFLDYFNLKTIILIALIVILSAGAILYFVFSRGEKNVKTGGQTSTSTEEQAGDNEQGASRLPGAWEGNGAAGNGNGGGDEIQAETLAFGDFYEKEDDNFEFKPAGLGLPINVKSDVTNYYDISRKINLDPYIDQLNKNGFAVIANPFADQADNFYGAYDLLIKKEAPVFVTGDFLIYYYQNILKSAYKEIEKNIFYREVWQINKSLYETANGKYMEMRRKAGVVNSPLLEGKRLEAAYFAVVLELLKPKSEQISEETYSIDKFNKQEASEFEFNLPDYLEEDARKEVDLITKAGGTAKSKIFLYNRDYKEFAAPEEYKSNAKLYNYYLAFRWMNSVFPLYYQDGACPQGEASQECLLDRNDWLINMIAACSIARDFSDNQEFKNNWAKIYKIISFFSGLSRDLTYLHYNSALIELFGKDYKIDEMFSSDNPQRDDNALKLREKIVEYEFLGIEGGIDRADNSAKPLLGMRLLQKPYWPDDYIFSRLTSPNAASYAGQAAELKNKSNNITYCNAKAPYRCRGIGLDVVNLIYSIPESNGYFKENTNYQNYAGQAAALRSQLDNFNIDSWHNNNYWATLSIAKPYLESTDSSARPIFIDNAGWKEKNINTVLGAWVNMQLPVEIFESGIVEDNKFGVVIGDYDYIEPDLVLINELIANAKMLSRIFLELKVLNDKDFAYIKLTDLTAELASVKYLIKKELNNEILDYDDRRFVYNLTKKFIVKESAEKSMELKFADGSIMESVKGVKLLMVVYNLGDKKFFAVGPIFNYKEELKKK